MKYPEFFNDIEPIVLKDKLSEFLGSTEKGIIEFSYIDIVKMSGHSCGVTSGAYLMTLMGLKELYGEEIPVRGEIKAELSGTLEDNTGVFAQVFMLITGATSNSGFLGIKGSFNRRNLLFYGADIHSNVRFTRLDTGKSVEVKYDLTKAVNPGEILQSSIGPYATDEDKKTFPIRWQQMVKTIFDNVDKVIEVKA
jgi:hypothetical protein